MTGVRIKPPPLSSALSTSLVTRASTSVPAYVPKKVTTMPATAAPQSIHASELEQRTRSVSQFGRDGFWPGDGGGGGEGAGGGGAVVSAARGCPMGPAYVGSGRPNSSAQRRSSSSCSGSSGTSRLLAWPSGRRGGCVLRARYPNGSGLLEGDGVC